MPENVLDLPLYQTWHNCDPKEGGKPLCQLPTIKHEKGYTYTKTAQLMGCSLRELQNGRRDTPLNRHYDTFVITDFPSRDADRNGMPMWGDAGEVLCALLRNAQFDLDRTYITCHAKCAPPNRKVAASEYTVCRRHLEYELHKFQPKLIIPLGSEGLKVFNLDGEGGITSVHGIAHNMKYPRWEEDIEFTVIPTFHPKQYLATGNAKFKNLIQEDLNKARGLLGDNVVIDNKFYKAKFQVIETVEELDLALNTILINKVFAFDTESPDLHFMSSPCMLLQMSCGEGKTWVIPFYQYDPEGSYFGGKWKLKPKWSFNGKQKVLVEKLKTIFENEEIAKCAHNIKYDLNVLRRWFDINIKGWLWDTQIMHHMIDTTPPHGLKELSDMEFFVGNYEGSVREIVGFGRNLIKTYDNVPDDILWQYGATDAEVTYRLLERYYPEITRKPAFIKLYTEESLPTLYTLAEAEWNGNHLNVANVQALGKSMDDEMDTLLVELRAATTPDFNPSSPDQCAEAFRKEGFGDEILNPKKVKGYSTDKNMMLKLTELGSKTAAKVVRYRNRKKFKGTYVEKAMLELDGDGRIRYGFNMTGTVSARLTCTFLHQLPRSNKDDIKAGRLVMRDMIDEASDYVYYYADYSQIELRVFAQQTGEQALLDVLLDPKGDVHRFTAAAALGVSPDKISDFNRQEIGKPMNFGIIYGSEGASLAKLMYEDPITGEKKLVGEMMAFELVRNYRQTYPKIDEYLSITPDLARANGLRVKTPFGREILIPDLNNKEPWRRAEAERSATNVSIQSPAGAISFRTMCMMKQILDDLQIGPEVARLVGSVHDSISYGVHKDYVDWFDGVFKQVAQRPIPELGNMEFPVNTGWGLTWAEAERAAH
jgi:DNA polymerase-1